MKTPILYNILAVLSLLCGLATSFYVSLSIIALITGVFSWPALEAAFGFFVPAVVLYAIVDIGKRLIRIEAAQWRLQLELEKARDERHAA
ncbi:MAG TPA: hypothetical protein VMB22_02400 [Verrucomicrobiae bacterium]|nr:hypothetical protein [Verrucomicrobiae bacterium]